MSQPAAKAIFNNIPHSVSGKMYKNIELNHDTKGVTVLVLPVPQDGTEESLKGFYQIMLFIRNPPPFSLHIRGAA